MSASRPNLVQRAGLFAIKMGQWRPQTLRELDQYMDYVSGGGPSSSGMPVNADTAMNFSAFFDGVMQISQTIASCPTILYKMAGEFEKNPWKTHTIYKLFLGKVNPFMDYFTWKERMQHHAIMWGNAYSFIQRDGGLRPIAFWPLNPARMDIKVDYESETPSVIYIYRPLKGEPIEYRQDQIFHLKGFGFDPFKGYSLLELAREAIGLGLSQQAFTGTFTANGTHLGGVLATGTKVLSDEARERLKKQIAEMHAGVENAGKVLLLEEGMDFKPFAMPLADAQFLESKVFEIAEIARFLNISPYKLKDYSKATFSNIEHLGIEYATDTIRPWAERWEAAINTQLLTETESLRAFAEFDLTAITRGDFKTQMEALGVARQNGAVNADEFRYRMNMNPIEDKRVGKQYWRPKNMADASLPDADQTQGAQNA